MLKETILTIIVYIVLIFFTILLGSWAISSLIKKDIEPIQPKREVIKEYVRCYQFKCYIIDGVKICVSETLNTN